MQIEIKLLSKCMADGGRQVYRYWSGDLKISRQRGKNDSRGNRLELEISV